MGKSAAQVTKKPKPGAQPEAIPLLRDGDRMGVDEFLRRYAADPVVYSAELLQGVVHITRRRESQNGKEMIVPPISAGGHSQPHASLITWLGSYAAFTEGVAALSPITTILPSRTTGLEPDAVIRILPESGGGSTIGGDGFLHGTPELLAEISFTSGSRDFGKKYDAYEAEGVPEYLIWRTAEKEVHWFALKRKKYVALEPHSDGTLRSGQFPGLWLDVPALLAGDMAKVLATLQQGIASPEHAAFVSKLRKAAAKKKK